MAIPQTYINFKRAQVEEDMPHLAKYPKIMQEFLAAALAAEWNMPPQCKKITVTMGDDNLIAMQFSVNTSSPVTVKLAIAELQDLHAEISRVLGI